MDKAFPERLAQLKAQLGKVILGKSEVIQDLVIALLSGGHILMEDVPGVGKTTLAKAAGGECRRTPKTGGSRRLSAARTG